MFRSIRRKIKNGNEIVIFNLLEDPAHKILVKYYNDNRFIEERDRLELNDYYTGVGLHRLLAFFCLQNLEDSNSRLISFYENCKRPTDTPHYEDLFNTLLFGLSISIMIEIIKWSLRKGLDTICIEFGKNAKEFPFQEITDEYKEGIEYLFRARLLRKIFFQRKISRQQHDESLVILKLVYFEHVEKKLSLDIERELDASAKEEGYELANLFSSLVSALVTSICREFGRKPSESLRDKIANLLKEEQI